jgi:hypothetical protein
LDAAADRRWNPALSSRRTTVVVEKVLVTGGCGRLGRYVVDELRRRYQITTLDVVDSPWTLPHLKVDILDLPGLLRAEPARCRDRLLARQGGPRMGADKRLGPHVRSGSPAGPVTDVESARATA